jgi:hypothetical protein
MTIIEGAENIERFQLIRMRKALELEMRTGMKHSRGSVLAAAQRQFGIKSRTKAGAVTELQTLLEQTYED